MLIHLFRESAWDIKAPFGEALMTVPFGRHRVLSWVIIKHSAQQDKKVAAAILEARALDNSNRDYVHMVQLIHQEQINHAVLHEPFSDIETIFSAAAQNRKALSPLVNSIDRITMARIIKRLWDRDIQAGDQLGTYRAIKESIAIRDRVRCVFRCQEAIEKADPIIDS